MSLTRVTLTASASVTHRSTSVPSSATSAGASAAVADLLRDLDDDLSDKELVALALEDSMMRKQRKMNLMTVMSHESVAGRRNSSPKTPWTPDISDARLVHVAAVCSQAVYQNDASQSFLQMEEGFTVEDTYWTEPSRDGRHKAAAVFKIREATSSKLKNGHPLIVVAVRGSSSNIDWLVNMNASPTAGFDLVDIPDPPLIHFGFGGCARALAEDIEDLINLSLSTLQGHDVDVVFTGHSAGGSVAALLYCRYLTRNLYKTPLLVDSLRLSCVTFGASPTLSTDVNPWLDKEFSRPDCYYLKGVTLAFLAEGDPVPRMDVKYASKLAKIYNEVGGTHCASVQDIGLFEPETLPWFHLGQMVLLHDGYEDSDELDLRATIISHAFLESCSWGNLIAHKMKETYVPWTSLIGVGCFNIA